MDPASLALTAAGLIAKQALEAAGGKAGEGAWAGLRRLAETIRRRFAGDHAGGHEVIQALDRLESQPSDPVRSEELAKVLAPRLDADLIAELTRLVEQVKVNPQTASFVTTVQDNAQVGKLTNIGQVSGDVHL
jgi:hypothetical protein